jgi:hypothetical protein
LLEWLTALRETLMFPVYFKAYNKIYR